MSPHLPPRVARKNAVWGFLVGLRGEAEGVPLGIPEKCLEVARGMPLRLPPRAPLDTP